MFADEEISEGKVVARMEACVATTANKWASHQLSYGLPEYAHIEVQGGGRTKWHYDAGFTDVAKPPDWYKLNHSCKANTKVVLDLRGQICFVSLRLIPRGEELVFTYSSDHREFDERWCNCGFQSRS